MTDVRVRRPIFSWLSYEPTPVAANIALIGLAVFALLWAVARAHVQAVTGDEGVTYTLFIERDAPYHWSPSSNNHLLNTILIRLCTSIFGLSPITLRIGALIGAAICISAAFWMCKLVSAKWTVQVPLFVCLIYNPLMFDFFVAARGYALATGFMMWTIAIMAWCYLYPQGGTSRHVIRACAFSSAFLALSFTSNFSFAFVIGVTLLTIFLWGLRTAQSVEPEERWRVRMKILAACTLPGLAVIILLPLHTLLHFPKSELYWGGKSIAETLHSVASASLFQVNPFVVNPLLLPVFSFVGHYLWLALCLAALFQLSVVWWNHSKLRGQADGRRALLAAGLLGITVLTLFAHYMAFRWFGLLIPKHRLALWIVPVCTLTVGLLASISLPSRVSRASRGLLVAVICVLGLYYFASLRLSYFQEWQYQQDVDKVYSVVAWYNHNRCVTEAEVSWWYHGAMRIYRSMSGRENPVRFTMNNPIHPPDKQLYILNSAFEGRFIEEQGLKVVYHGEHTDVVVAVRPEFLEPPKGPCRDLPQP